MKRAYQFTLAACLLTSASLTGCQSMGVTARAQSPECEPPVAPAGGVDQAGHLISAEDLAEGVQDAYNQFTPLKRVVTGVQGAYQHSDHAQAMVSELRDCYHEHHNTTTTYYDANPRPPFCQTDRCPPSYYGGAGCPQGCPPGVGMCPLGLCPMGVACPHGGCHGGHCGNELNHYPHHGHTYSYERPNDLVYPPAGGVGGAVVYPYYTHRGPSDFFRDDPKDPGDFLP